MAKLTLEEIREKISEIEIDMWGKLFIPVPLHKEAEKECISRAYEALKTVDNNYEVMRRSYFEIKKLYEDNWPTESNPKENVFQMPLILYEGDMFWTKNNMTVGFIKRDNDDCIFRVLLDGCLPHRYNWKGKSSLSREYDIVDRAVFEDGTHQATISLTEFNRRQAEKEKRREEKLKELLKSKQVSGCRKFIEGDNIHVHSWEDPDGVGFIGIIKNGEIKKAVPLDQVELETLQEQCNKDFERVTWCSTVTLPQDPAAKKAKYEKIKAKFEELEEDSMHDEDSSFTLVMYEELMRKLDYLVEELFGEEGK